MLINRRERFQTIKRIAICTGLIIGTLGHVPSAMAVGGTPAYQLETVPFQWNDTSKGIKQSANVEINIGFDFQFYGTTFKSMSILESGVLILGPTANMNYYTPASRIRVFQNSLSLHYPSSALYTLLEGTAPNRRLTVSWVDMAYLDPSPGCISDSCDGPPPDIYFGKGTFQATLYEGSNDIVFRYLDVVFSDDPAASLNPDYGANGTVAVENNGNTQGTLYSYRRPSISNASALRFFVGKPANLSPIANAGPDQSVYEGQTVYLRDNGSSDPDGSIVSYVWSQFFDYLPYYESAIYSRTANTSFGTLNVNADTVYIYQLTVTDNRGAYTTDRLNLTVRNVQ